MYTNPKTRIFLAASAVLIALAIGLQLVMGNAQAQLRTQSGDPAGTTIPYTGELTGDNGNPVTDGAYDFVFILYDANEGGSLLWSETQTGVRVSGGRFAVMLGSVNPLPQLGKVTASWLQVSVRGAKDQDFTLLVPRQRLSAEAADAPTNPSAVGTCPHMHLGENWIGNFIDYAFRIENLGSGSGIASFTHATEPNAAFYGDNNGTGDALHGFSTAGSGVYAESYSGTALYAVSDSNDAIEAEADTSEKSAVYAHNTSGYGVYAISDTGRGVHAESGSAAGVYAKSTSGAAVNASSASGVGIYASSSTGDGIDASTSANDKSAVYAHSVNGYGVTASSDNNWGLQVTGGGDSYLDTMGDIVLGGDAGEIFYFGDTNMVLYSNSNISMQLDNDDTSEDWFSIINGDGANVFHVTESGNIVASGSKAGYVVDIAQNDDTVFLERGDVVIISGAGPAVVGKNPVIKVRLAAIEATSAIIGVVDEVFIPELMQGNKSDSSTSGSGNNDTVIAPGKYLTVVTLGSFQAIKVDASYGAIAPGDLLVASPNPGYAMRTASPAPGTIIGKALGALESGTGIIPVIVTIQ